MVDLSIYIPQSHHWHLNHIPIRDQKCSSDLNTHWNAISQLHKTEHLKPRFLATQHQKCTRSKSGWGISTVTVSWSVFSSFVRTKGRIAHAQRTLSWRRYENSVKCKHITNTHIHFTMGYQIWSLLTILIKYTKQRIYTNKPNFTYIFITKLCNMVTGSIRKQSKVSNSTWQHEQFSFQSNCIYIDGYTLNTDTEQWLVPFLLIYCNNLPITFHQLHWRNYAWNRS